MFLLVQNNLLQKDPWKKRNPEKGRSLFSFFLSSLSFFLQFLFSRFFTARTSHRCPSLDPDHRGNGREERTPDLGRTPNHQRERTPSFLFFFFSTESNLLLCLTFSSQENFFLSLSPFERKRWPTNRPTLRGVKRRNGPALLNSFIIKYE